MKVIFEPGAVSVVSEKNGEKHRAAVGRGDANDASEFFAKVIKLLTDAGMQKPMARSCEQFARKSFDDGTGQTRGEIEAEESRGREEAILARQRAEAAKREEFMSLVAATVEQVLANRGLSDV